MASLKYPGEENVWHPFTPTPHSGPLALLTRASGAYVWDDKGNRYFDASSSWWCNLHGHCHPRLVKALADQAAQLDHVMFAPHSHPTALQLAKELIEILGEPFSRVFYSDNGSTAVETALKIAAQYWQIEGEPQRRYFLSLERSYHGDTVGAMSVTNLSQFQGPFDHLKFPAFQSTVAYCDRCPLNLTYPQCSVACLDKTLALIRSRGKEIAALIVEPLLMGAGGMIIYPKEYLERLVPACREAGILVIFDEVLTGFGRTGTMFAMEQLVSRPDMVCLAKGLTSGMLPLSATVVTEKLFAAFQGSKENTFYHGHTFTANALGCAVGLESLAIFRDDNVLEKNKKLQTIMAGQTAKFLGLDKVGCVRHLGMVWALELVKNKSTQEVFEPANGPGWKVAEFMWERGYWLRPLNQVIYVMPPYCTTETELQDFFSVLYSAIDHVSKTL